MRYIFIIADNKGSSAFRDKLLITHYHFLTPWARNQTRQGTEPYDIKASEGLGTHDPMTVCIYKLQKESNALKESANSMKIENALLQELKRRSGNISSIRAETYRLHHIVEKSRAVFAPEMKRELRNESLSSIILQYVGLESAVSTTPSFNLDAKEVRVAYPYHLADLDGNF